MEAPAVDVSDLSRRFGHVRALRGISFTLAPGSITGLQIVSGCGFP